MAKGCALSTGYLPLEGLPRNSVDRQTDRPDMTSAIDRGRKSSTQTNKQKHYKGMPGMVSAVCFSIDRIRHRTVSQVKPVISIPTDHILYFLA